MRTLFLAGLYIAVCSGRLPAQVPCRAQLFCTFTPAATGLYASPVFAIPLQETRHFVAFTLRCRGENTSGDFRLRHSADGQIWGDWQMLDADVHADTSAGFRQFEMLFLPNETRFVQIQSSNLQAALAGELIFYSPVQTPDTDPLPAVYPFSGDLLACPCVLPAYINRPGWGGPPTQQPGCTPSYTAVTHLIVHHQAGVANPPYSAVVQAIWQLHVNTNGWCDIGYNWLIAPDGTVFEGRAGGNNVLGAHFCGTNGNTMGVCFLGNYQNDQPTAAAQASLVKLLAWKCCDSGIEPTGSAFHASSGLTLNRISGHRDGCSTLCPGDNLYVRLPNIRLETDSFYHDPTGCDGIWPPANDACAGATQLTSAETCQPFSATTSGASASGVPVPTCNGFTSGSALDVWFQFTAVEPQHRVIVVPRGQAPEALDAVVAGYDGNCGALQLLACADTSGGSGGTTVLNLTGLTPGQTYWVRVFDFGNAPAADGRFDICILHGASVPTSTAPPMAAWQMFPNPSDGRLTLLRAGGGPVDCFFRLYDATGRLLVVERLTRDHFNVDLTRLPAGLYWAEMHESSSISRRVLIRN